MRAFVLFLGVVAPGWAVMGVCTYFLMQDWSALQRSFTRWEQAQKTAGAVRFPTELIVADTYQQVFRLNCFAEGVGVLLGAILAAVGIVGLCLLPREKK